MDVSNSKKYNDPIAMSMDFTSLYPTTLKIHLSKKRMEIIHRKDKLKKIIDKINDNKKQNI